MKQNNKNTTFQKLKNKKALSIAPEKLNKLASKIPGMRKVAYILWLCSLAPFVFLVGRALYYMAVSLSLNADGITAFKNTVILYLVLYPQLFKTTGILALLLPVFLFLTRKYSQEKI